MATCERCGNDYDKSFEVRIGGQNHTFDSFECAIATVAPQCSHCGTRIIGHGMEARGKYYCCQNCADAEGITGLKDRVQ
jgi:hypothetical protein